MRGMVKGTARRKSAEMETEEEVGRRMRQIKTLQQGRHMGKIESEVIEVQRKGQREGRSPVPLQPCTYGLARPPRLPRGSELLNAAAKTKRLRA